MSEIEGLQDVETSTIHLLLVKAEANFKPNPIDQTLIIDESSMLDITLMHKLVKYMEKYKINICRRCRSTSPNITRTSL